MLEKIRKTKKEIAEEKINYDKLSGLIQIPHFSRSLTQLEVVICYGDVPGVRELISQGAELPDDHFLISIFLENESIKSEIQLAILSILLNAGLDPNQTESGDKKSSKLLASVIKKKNWEMAKMLFEAGATTDCPEVAQELEKLRKEEESETNQQLLDIFYRDGKLLRYSEAYLISLLPKDPESLSGVLSKYIPNNLKDIVIHYYIAEDLDKRFIDKLLNQAKDQQTTIAVRLMRAAEGIPLPLAFSLLKQRLFYSSPFGEDKIKNLVRKAMDDYVATNVQLSQSEISPDKFFNTLFFKKLKEIVGVDLESKKNRSAFFQESQSKSQADLTDLSHNQQPKARGTVDDDSHLQIDKSSP